MARSRAGRVRAKGRKPVPGLLEAAKAVFEEDGFLEARISDIAERAGLSHGSFYHYFDSKEQIFREVATAVEDELTAPVDAVIFDSESHATPRERIQEGIRRHLLSYRKEAPMMGVIEQVSRYDEHVRAIVKDLRYTTDRPDRGFDSPAAAAGSGRREARPRFRRLRARRHDEQIRRDVARRKQPRVRLRPRRRAAEPAIR